MKTAKKLLSLLLCVCMVMTCAGFGSAYAEEGDHTHTYDLDQEPAWDWADDFSSSTATFTCTGCSETVDITDDAPVETPVSDATCTAEKVASFVATVEFEEKTFTDTQEEVSVPGTMVPHSFTNYVPDEGTATCTADGTKTAKCDNCDATDTITDEGSKLGHDYVETVVLPTCTEKGYTEHKCSRCDDVYYTDVTPAAGHNYGEPEWTWATDYSAATATFACQTEGCSDTKTLKSTVDVAETISTVSCTEDGVVKYIATVNLDGTDYTDTTDEVTIAVATDHTYGEPEWKWEEDNSKATATFTCEQNDDTKEIDATIYTTVVTEADCVGNEVVTYTAIVFFAGQQYIDEKKDIELADTALNHIYDAEITPATCTAAGVTTYTCLRCGNTYTADNVDALGHSFTNYKPNDDAKCTEDGTKTAKCDRCDVTSTLVDEDSALGHSFTNYASNNDATCTEDGTKTAKCDRCDVTDKITDAGSALGHDMDYSTTDGNSYHTKKEATGSDDEKHIFKCRREGCPYEETISIDGTRITTHSYDEKNGYKVISDNQHYAICTVVGCSEKYDEATLSFINDYIPELKGRTEGPHINIQEHLFLDYVYDAGSATCYSKGTMTGTCKCGAKETRANTLADGGMLDHVYAKAIGDDGIEHTWICADDGTHTRSCPVCEAAKAGMPESEWANYHFFEKVTEKHDYDEWQYMGDSTFFKDGHEERFCKDCGHREEQIANGTSALKKIIGEILGASVFLAWVYTGISFALAKWFGVTDAYLTDPPAFLRNK